jgi:hypothetical protein
MSPEEGKRRRRRWGFITEPWNETKLPHLRQRPAIFLRKMGNRKERLPQMRHVLPSPEPFEQVQFAPHQVLFVLLECADLIALAGLVQAHAGDPGVRCR